MGCSDKLKHTCGTRTNSRCVFYDEFIPNDSDLSGEDCITIEETTKDLYTITKEIKEEIDLSELGNDCLEYDEEDGKVKVKDALKKLEEEVCLLKNTDTNSTDCCIDLNNIDTSCLEDICGTGFSTPTSLIQALILKICQLEAQINDN